MPWNLLVVAVAQTAPQLIADLLALKAKHDAGQVVTAAEWEAFEQKYLALSGEQRLLSLAKKIA